MDLKFVLARVFTSNLDRNPTLVCLIDTYIDVYRLFKFKSFFLHVKIIMYFVKNNFNSEINKIKKIN